jgi:hypothetical protein
MTTPRSSYVKRSELFGACVKGNLEDVQNLIKSGEDCNQKVSIIDKIMDKEDEIHIMTPIEISVAQGRDAIVLELLRAGVDANYISEENTPVLHMAVMSGSVDTVRHLIRFKSDISLLDGNGRTALYHTKDVTIIEMIMEEEMSRKKCVAFAMGHHKRLGIASHLTGFPPEMLRMVVESV